MIVSAVAADAMSGCWTDIHLYKRVASFADQWPVGPTGCQSSTIINFEESGVQNVVAQNDVSILQ